MIDTARPISSIEWPACTSSGTIKPPQNAKYCPSNVNILGCALRSVHNAILAGCSDDNQDPYELIGGILWYQGCNDAVDLEHVSRVMYPKRFPKLMEYIREALVVVANGAQKQLRSSGLTDDEALHRLLLDKNVRFHAGISIPIVTVAITSTRPMLRHIKEIRQYQLNYANKEVPNLAVVDALGAALSQDSIHLETKSYLILGHLLALQMLNLKKTARSLLNSLSSSDLDYEWLRRNYFSVNEFVPVMSFPMSSAADRKNEVLFIEAVSRAHTTLSAANGYMRYYPAMSSVFTTGMV